MCVCACVRVCVHHTMHKACVYSLCAAPHLTFPRCAFYALYWCGCIFKKTLQLNLPGFLFFGCCSHISPRSLHAWIVNMCLQYQYVQWLHFWSLPEIQTRLSNFSSDRSVMVWYGSLHQSNMSMSTTRAEFATASVPVTGGL